MKNPVTDVFLSPCFWSGFCGWMTAQFTKMVCGYCEKKRLDFSYIVSTGGMPSAHSALVGGLSASVGIQMGFGSPLFVVMLGVAMITMFDASTVRRAAGQQASILNQMIDTVFEEHRFPEEKLAELLGHTRLEVFMGFIMGIFVAMIVNSVAVLT